MSKPLHPIALFRLSVLGPLASRGQFKRGEVKTMIRELANQTYHIPDSRRTHLSEQTILRWYREWKKQGIDGLVPKERCDKGETQLSADVQDALVLYKKDNPARSLNTLMRLVEKEGLAVQGKLPRASVHRFLQSQQLSQRVIADKHTIERRSFEAKHAGDIWQGDVLHGPSIQTSRGMRKIYLVSLLDDASRLLAHSAFCFGETALDIEGVLKQAILKRGLPRKLLIDNGPAYRSESLQSICARLEIRLIYCRPYEPEGKGKLERFHRTFREQFLNEVHWEAIHGLADINARLWAWLEQVYHCRLHQGLGNKTPLERWREDLLHVRPLGLNAHRIDDIFYHRIERHVNNDSTVRWESHFFEVAYEHRGKTVMLVVDPHTQTALRIESKQGDDYGPVTLLDKHSNCHRKRQRPHRTEQTPEQIKHAVERDYHEYSQLCDIPSTAVKNNEEK